jgi:hypothetical protein
VLQCCGYQPDEFDQVAEEDTHRVAAYCQDASTCAESESQDAKSQKTVSHVEHIHGDDACHSACTQGGMGMHGLDGTSIHVSTHGTACVDPTSAGVHTSLTVDHNGHQDVAARALRDQDMAARALGDQDMAARALRDQDMAARALGDQDAAARALGGVLTSLLRDERIVKLGYGMGYDINKVCIRMCGCTCMCMCMCMCIYVFM